MAWFPLDFFKSLHLHDFHSQNPDEASETLFFNVPTERDSKASCWINKIKNLSFIKMFFFSN